MFDRKWSVKPNAKVVCIELDDAVAAMTVAAFLIRRVVRVCPSRKKLASMRVKMGIAPQGGRYQQTKALRLPATALPCPNSAFGASLDHELDRDRLADATGVADQRDGREMPEPF